MVKMEIQELWDALSDLEETFQKKIEALETQINKLKKRHYQRADIK